MALAIRSLWQRGLARPKITNVAVPALIEGTDRTKYPESYTASLGTLRDIGDPRAIPAAKREYTRETDPETRYFINEMITELEKVSLRRTTQNRQQFGEYGLIKGTP